MGIWEDLELTEKEDDVINISKFISWFEEKKSIRTNALDIIKKIKNSGDYNSKIDNCKKLFIFKKISEGGLRHLQKISKENFVLTENNLKRILKTLRQKYKTKYTFRIFSTYTNENNFTSLIKVKSKDKEIINRITTNYTVPRTRVFIIDKIGKKLNLYFSYNVFSKWDAAKISEDISSILKIDSFPQLDISNLSKEFEKIIKLKNLIGINFKETILQGNPRLKIDSRNIVKYPLNESLEVLKEYLDKDARSILSFKLDLSVPLNIKVRRTLRKFKNDSEEKCLGIIYNFSDRNLTEEDILFLESNGIINNYTILDPQAKRPIRDQIENLLNSKGALDYWGPVLNAEGRECLRERNFITSMGLHNFKINYNEIEKYIKSLFLEQDYKIKKIKNLRLKSKNFSFFFADKESESFYILFIKKSDMRSVKSILNYCDKRSIYPIFISISDIEKVKDQGYYQISLSDLLCERKIDEASINQIFQNSRNRYKEVKGKSVRIALDTIKQILKSPPTRVHGLEAEKKTGILLESIFPNAQKLGGPYIPDGIILISYNGKVILWDAKYWLNASFCKNKDEIKKIRKYILHAKRNPLIKSIGKFKDFWIIGKIDQENFKEFIKKIKIRDIKLKFIDFKLFKKIIELYLSNDELELAKNKFYSLAREALLNNNLSKIENLEKIFKNSSKKLIDEKKFRKDN